MEEIELKPEKSFQIELSTDKKDLYSVIFNLNNSIEIKENKINDIIHKSFSCKYTFEEIRKNKYFLQFDTINEIFDELKERIYNSKIIIKEKEKENNLYINILLPSSKNKEIVFELKPIIKNNNTRLNELTDLIIKLEKEINNIKNGTIYLTNEDISNLTKEIKQQNYKINNLGNSEIQLRNENKELKIQINYMKDKLTQLINGNNQILNDINLLKNENIQLKKEIKQLKTKNTQWINNETPMTNESPLQKKEITELKEKLNVLWRKETSKIIYSKIINGNKNYIKTLKNWINPSKKIKAELLYRLSENGDKYSAFHELCDNKGPTLTLFHVNDENIVGIYTPLSWDSTSKWKNDMDTFIFNLNKNQKYKKIKADYSIYCSSLEGPYVSNFGCDYSYSMKSIKHNANKINEYYDNASEILPINNQEKIYNLIETEVYKIIIGE